MRRLFHAISIATALFACGSLPAFAQTAPQTYSSTGTLGAAQAAVLLNPNSAPTTCSFVLSGTWVGTVTFEASADGGATYPLALGTATANGTTVYNCAGYFLVRARMSAYTSGTATATVTTSASLATTGGAATSGSVTAPGTNGTQAQAVQGTTGGVPVATTTEPTAATYTATQLTIANAGVGVFYELTGAAGHVIRVRSCLVGGLATTAGYTTILARVLSTTDTGGTATTAPIVGPFVNGNTTAATAVAYSTPPTQGTQQTTAFSQQVILESTTAGTQPPQSVFMDFPNTENSQAPTLLSASQQFVISTLTAQAGASFNVSCKFTDTAS